MPENKKSFILYSDLIHTVSILPNDKAGELFKHILNYVNGLDIEPDDLLIKISFEPIRQQFNRDNEKWDNNKSVRSENGRRGGIAKAEKNQQNVANVANASFAKKNVANVAVNVNVNDNVNVNVINDEEKEEEKENPSPSPPDKPSKYALIFERHESGSLEKELLSSEQWHSDLCLGLKNKKGITIMPEMAKSKINDFMINLAAQGKYPIKLSEAKSYFVNWIAQQLSRPNNGNNSSPTQGMATI